MLIELPGLYKGVPNEDYHASPGISSSGISLIVEPNCPKVYWDRYLSGDFPPKKAEHFLLGSALHTLTLEPETFHDRFHVFKKINRTTTAGKESYAEQLMISGGKKILDEQEYNHINEMAKSVKEHALFKKLKRKGFVEDSLMWRDRDTGALLRSRPDFYTYVEGYGFLILDVKTTNDISPRAFSYSLEEWGYHRQGAMACDGLTEVTGDKYDTVVLFVVSKQRPYLSRSYLIGDISIQEGRAQYKRGAEVYQRCLDSGIWPGYDEILTDINLPARAFRSEMYA